MQILVYNFCQIYITVPIKVLLLTFIGLLYINKYKLNLFYQIFIKQ